MAQGNNSIALLASIGITGAVLFFGAQYVQQYFSENPENEVISTSPAPNAPRSNNSSSSSSSNSNPSSPATFAEVENVPQGLFSYGGSTTWAPIRGEIDGAIPIVKPGFELRYTDPAATPPGSGAGIKMLLNNQLAFSQSSRPLKPEEYEQAEQKGFTLQEISVALDGLAIAVHPDLQVAGLTVAQLRDIYLGKITNWQEVGGPNLAIIPYTRDEEAGGTVDFFIEAILDGEPFGTTKKYVFSTTEALRLVSQNLGGIYYGSAPEIVPQCTVKSLPLGRSSDQLVAPYLEPFKPLSNCPTERNTLNNAAFKSGDYPITRSLFVIVKRNNATEQQAGEAYANLLLTPQGQDLIEKAGFVRIR